MAPKAPLDVKLEVLLDDKNKKFYPGDQVEGKIFITSNQSYTLTNLRLAWTGRIQVQPIQSNKDSRIYFDECWKLGPKLTKAPTKTTKGSNTSVPYFYTNLILVAADNDLPEPKVELSKNKTVGFAFKVHVPNDRPLPSSTVGSALNKIIYLLEAFIDQQKETTEANPVFFGQRVVPVLEAIHTRTEELMLPQRAEQVFMVSLLNQNIEFTSAMRVTLPCRGCQPGVAIPVSITIWNNMEFSRKQGISISLFRVNQVLANGRAYTSPGEKVHRVVADLNITADEKHSAQKTQTVRVGLPIPKGITPTITLEKSILLSIAYYVRAQVFAQEGVYTTAEGVKSQFMVVDIPFVVGTLASPIEGSKSSTTITSTTSPFSSPKSSNSGMITSPTASNISRAETPLSSPKSSNISGVSTLTSAFIDPSTLGYFNNNQPSNRNSVATTISTSSNQANITPITSPEISNQSTASAFNNAAALPANKNNNIETDSVITITSGSSTTSATLIDNNGKKGSRMMGGIFRKSSSGSNVSTVSSEDSSNGSSGKKKKKSSVFSSLKMYGRGSSNKSKTTEEELDDQGSSIATTENTEKVHVNQPSLVQPQEDQPTLPVSNQGGGVFNIFPDDDDDDDEILSEGQNNHQQQHRKEEEIIFETKVKDDQQQQEKQAAGNIFNMFPDSDSDDEEEVPNNHNNPQQLNNGTTPTEKVFKMFPDSDDEDEEEENHGNKEESFGENNSRSAANIEDPSSFQNSTMTNQRLLTSHVFKMFDDSTDDEAEETDVQDLSISKYNIDKEQVLMKPFEPNSNSQEKQYDKPNKKEDKEEVYYHKPNTMDNDHYANTDSSSEEDDENDLLAALAKREKLSLSSHHRKIA